MQKLFLLSLGCVLATSAAAQTGKGSRFIGANLGDLSYSRGKRNFGNRSFSVALYPSAGVFVTDNFLVGTGLQLGYSNYKPGNVVPDYSARTFTYGLAPFGRYYLPGSGPHRFYGQLEAGVTGLRARHPLYYSSGTRNYSDHYGTAGLSLGYNYFLTPVAALQVSAGYHRYFGGSKDFPPYQYIGNIPNDTKGAFRMLAGFSVFLPATTAGSAPTN